MFVSWPRTRLAAIRRCVQRPLCGEVAGGVCVLADIKVNDWAVTSPDCSRRGCESHTQSEDHTQSHLSSSPYSIFPGLHFVLLSTLHLHTLTPSRPGPPKPHIHTDFKALGLWWIQPIQLHLQIPLGQCWCLSNNVYFSSILILLISFLFFFASPAQTSWQRWSPHRLVRTFQGLPPRDHPHWVRRCANYHLPHEEPHVFHPHTQKTRGKHAGLGSCSLHTDL